MFGRLGQGICLAILCGCLGSCNSGNPEPQPNESGENVASTEDATPQLSSRRSPSQPNTALRKCDCAMLLPAGERGVYRELANQAGSPQRVECVFRAEDGASLEVVVRDGLSPENYSVESRAFVLQQGKVLQQKKASSSRGEFLAVLAIPPGSETRLKGLHYVRKGRLIIETDENAQGLGSLEGWSPGVLEVLASKAESACPLSP